MKRQLTLLLLSVGLSGCFDDVSDIQAYMDNIKASTPASIEPIPAVKEFAHVEYQGADKRSPFLKPKPEAIIDKLSLAKNCLQPDPKRQKEPLEQYALDNLKMKGTMGYAQDPWALIESTIDGALYRVSMGNYIGLFHGKITKVLNDKVELLEMIPDGTGCYKQRTTILDLSVPEVGGENA